jgi:flagellar hook protein FlgE
MGYEQGLSGLGTASTQLDVIGNNIANASTVGFKEGDAEFASLYSAELAQSTNLQVGIGSTTSTVANNFSQGDITTTNEPLNVAINGGGFFQLSNNGSIEYSRNGQFNTNADGYLVNASGANVQGYTLNATGAVTSTTLTNIQLNTANIPPVATTSVTMQFNLDSQATTPTVTTFSPTNTDSYTSESGTTVYDSLGNPIQLETFFVKAPTAGVWSVYETANGTALPSQGTLAAVTGTSSTYTGSSFTTNTALTSVGGSSSNTLLVNGTALTISDTSGSGITAADVAAAINADTSISPSVTATVNTSGDVVLTQTVQTYPTVTSAITVSGTEASEFFGSGPTSVTGTSTVASGTAAADGYVGKLTFSSTGALSSFANVAGVVSSVPGQVTLSVPAGEGGSSTPESINLNMTGTTQYGIAFDDNNQSQNGYTSGALTGYTISSEGVIQGNYSNGQSQPLAQLALVTFNDAQGLQSVGNNAYVETSESGQPVVGTPGGTNLGVLQSGAVESSNVDLTTQLVDLITAQRNYQANAQTIKTQQTVDQSLFNL